MLFDPGFPEKANRFRICLPHCGRTGPFFLKAGINEGSDIPLQQEGIPHMHALFFIRFIPVPSLFRHDLMFRPCFLS